MAPLTLGLRSRFFFLFAILAWNGCGDSVSREDHIRVDTYISSEDSANHSEEKVLRVSKNRVSEERILFKLPTGSKNSEETLQEAMSTKSKAIPIIPFLLADAILEELLDCKGSVLDPDHLTNAELLFQIDSSDEADLSGKLKLQLLTKPWWHTATWEKAHPFSSQGKWLTPGGDVHADWLPIYSQHQKENRVSFNVTSHFRDLLKNRNSVHFGFMIQAAQSSLKSVVFHSTQSEDNLNRPRLKSTYRCENRQRKTEFYLGDID